MPANAAYRNKTLNGGRAERNEYILLHEFHRLKYICPDKQWGKKAEIAAKIEVEEADGTGEAGAKKTKGKRDKYKGGLVFEPKRGLWDRYILVMDFNSLYPSIIQEYNIDFTTVERVEDEVRSIYFELMLLMDANSGRRRAKRRSPSHRARMYHSAYSHVSLQRS